MKTSDNVLSLPYAVVKRLKGAASFVAACFFKEAGTHESKYNQRVELFLPHKFNPLLGEGLSIIEKWDKTIG
ncbi:MAG: hypothetical protein PHD48_09395 [Alphaproteobacteria bacterium]|nr:hypothetical protein [Alphaproteobacteria bacterium]